jgi:hypothetical protein
MNDGDYEQREAYLERQAADFSPEELAEWAALDAQDYGYEEGEYLPPASR